MTRLAAVHVLDVAHDDCPDCSTLAHAATRDACAVGAPAWRVSTVGDVTHHAAVSAPVSIEGEVEE